MHDFRQLGTQVTIPRGHSDQVRIPRWQTPISSIKGALTGVAGLEGGAASAVQQVTTEGTIVSSFQLCAESITGTVKQWIGARAYGDKTIIVVKANFIEGALESLSRELSLKVDRHTRLNISANSFLAKAQTPGNLTAEARLITPADILMGKTIATIAPRMDARHVPRWEDEHFVGVTNPLAQYDIYRDASSTGFVSVARYNDAGRIYRGEIGNMYGVRWLLSTAIPYIVTPASVSATSAVDGLLSGVTGVNSYIFAPDAFYSIELEDGGVEVIHHPPGSSGSVSDPGNQRGSVAVKLWYGVAPAPSADKRLMRLAHALTLTF